MVVTSNKLWDPKDIAVNMYKRHLIIQLIKQRETVSEKFYFQQVSLEDILIELKNLDPLKLLLLAA